MSEVATTGAVVLTACTDCGGSLSCDPAWRPRGEEGAWPLGEEGGGQARLRRAVPSLLTQSGRPDCRARGGTSTLAQVFPEIAVAGPRKEALRTWYATTAAATCAADLDAWITAVKRDGPSELRTALSAFRNWRSEILAFFDFLPIRLSNGFVEGKNNRTKALMRQGYGYRNRRHLRLRILLEGAA
jgi:transposase